MLLLTDKETNNPQEALQQFFEDYHLSEVRQHLWNLFETAVTSQNDIYAEASERNKLLEFLQRVEKILEAAYLISEVK